MTSLRKLASLVALLVLCTGVAVAFYVDALGSRPVEAGYDAGGPWVQHADDVRVPTRRLHFPRERALRSPAPRAGARTSPSATSAACEVQRVLGAFEDDGAPCPATAATAATPDPAI